MIPGLISVKIVFINVVNEQIVFRQLKFVFFSQKAFFKHVHAVKRIGKKIFLLTERRSDFAWCHTPQPSQNTESSLHCRPHVPHGHLRLLTRADFLLAIFLL
jgi:hypothetical protein